MSYIRRSMMAGKLQAVAIWIVLFSTSIQTGLCDYPLDGASANA
jgi:hypothetical protein